MIITALRRFTLVALCFATPVVVLRAEPVATAAQVGADDGNPQGFKVGQRIEAWITVEWLPVTLLQIGGGPDPANPFLVAVGDPIRGIQPKRWLSARDVRPLSKPEPPPPAAPDVKVGDIVEGWITVEWLPVRLAQIGGGPDPAFPYLIEIGEPIGGIQPKRWLAAQHVRPRRRPDAPAAGPRTGRYIILSYGANPASPLRLGEIELAADGAYRFLNVNGRVLGSGKYRYESAERRVIWQDGILEERGWTGTFTIEREGKTHQLRLMRTTIAVNSIDSAGNRD
jgi:hypothetical protein